MPVTPYGHIVLQRQKPLNPPTDNPSLNRGATTTSPTRVPITPTNHPSRLSPRPHTRRRTGKIRDDRRLKIPLKTPPNTINTTPIQGTLPAIKRSNSLTIATIILPTPSPTTLSPIPIGKSPIDRIPPGIKPITRPHHPINHRLSTLPTGTRLIQLRLKLTRRLMNLLQQRQLVLIGQRPLPLNHLHRRPTPLNPPLQRQVLPGNLPTRI